MGLFKRGNATTSPEHVSETGKDEIHTRHPEAGTEQAKASGFKVNKAGEGDEALALFSTVADVHEDIDPEEEKKVVRKIDFMILPVSVSNEGDGHVYRLSLIHQYLAVCYCFFYIDKTTLSYAAIFGIEEDLNLHGTQYSWLRSETY